MNPLASVRLVKQDVSSIRRLPGFQKHHRVPTAVTKTAEQFVQSLTERDLADDLSSHFDALRRAFGLKRVEIQARGPKDGAGLIVTPYFHYEVAAWLDPDDPSQVVRRREVTEIRAEEPVLSSAFEEVFATLFDTLELRGEMNDLEGLVDRVEAMESPAIAVDYDRELTWCDLTIRGVAMRIRLTRDTLQIIASGQARPRALVRTYHDLRHELFGPEPSGRLGHE